MASHFLAGSLTKHMYNVHGGHKDQKCEFCCKSFTQVQHLKRHSTQFMKATNISNVKYVTYHLVHQECKTIENPDQKVHKCDFCSKLFVTTGDVNQHIMQCHSKKPNLCSNFKNILLHILYFYPMLNDVSAVFWGITFDTLHLNMFCCLYLVKKKEANPLNSWNVKVTFKMYFWISMFKKSHKEVFH